MWLSVAEYNTGALGFYTSYGFKPTGEARPGERGRHMVQVLINPSTNVSVRAGGG
jgi:hypothetical protein